MFRITECGAMADGQTVDTKTIQAAIIRDAIDETDPAIPGSFCTCIGDVSHAGPLARRLAGKGNPRVVRINNGRYLMGVLGLRWNIRPKPLLKKNSDTQQVCFHDGGRYRPLGPAGAFDSGSIYVMPGAICGDKPGTWWFYYLGLAIGHDGKQEYAGGYCRFLLRMAK